MVTSLFAGILALLYVKISLVTISARRKQRISLGSGPNDEIAAIVSAHNNFASYAVFLLLLLFLLEQSGKFPVLALYLGGAVFTLGRFLHFTAFRSEKMNFKLRVIGMHMTIWPLVAFGLLNIYSFGVKVFLN